MLKKSPAKKILLISQMYPSGMTGTSVKTRNTIEFLQKKGFQIDVCCLHHPSMVKKNLKLAGVRIFLVERDTTSHFTLKYALRVCSVICSPLPFRVKKTFDSRLAKMIQVLLRSSTYDFILFDGFSTLQYASKFDQKNIYVDDEDISDLMWRRFQETGNYLLKIFFWIEFKKCKWYERMYLARMWQIWAICQNSKKHLALSTTRPIILMPTFIQAQKNIFSNFAKDIVFTGLLCWLENVNGLKWFLEHAWSEIHQQHPQTKLYVIGQKAEPEFIEYLQSFPNVIHLGYVEKLEEYYQKSALAIAPLLINCGIKVKVVTYLSYGIPVVALPEAVWGMSEAAGVCVSSPQSFAQQVNRLLDDQVERQQLSLAGHQNIAQHHSEKALEKFFRRVKIL